jgi:hypothetical protein
MKTLISPLSLRRAVMLAVLSMLALVLSGCVNFNHPDLQPLPPDKTKKRVETWKHYMFGWPEDNTEAIVRKPLEIVKEIPAGNPGEGTIVKTVTVSRDSEYNAHKEVKYVYPNGYVSFGEGLDTEWRRKAPPRSRISVDDFNFSNPPLSSGLTSGTVIRSF